ncbi:MAG: N-methyl-L-tryptophan oxidase [Planctomycetia bacterium]|nr:MAG: N-methyl-L-tryptophan oxidase [Planctomycetia bacterium]
MKTYDAIVIGLGGMGSAACAHLARRGARVLGLEQFTPAHDRGSSHGETRIIRRAYFEHPDYVPLLNEAYRLWDELADSSARPLISRCGLLLVGAPDGEVISGVQRAAREHRLAIEPLDAAALRGRFGMIRAAPDMVGLHEADAGFLRVEECVRAHLALAASRGAELRFGAPVREWRRLGDGSIEVTTEGGRIAAGALVVTAGPWTASRLTAWAGRLEVRRKVQLWFGCDDDRYSAVGGFPAFCAETSDGFFYGFPSIRPGEIKIAEHSGRQPVANADSLDRSVDAADIVRVARFVTEFMPGVSPRVQRHSVCMYTMSPDGHFVVDALADAPNIHVACGFSGHGFKFASVIGDELATRALGGAPRESMEFLRASRFA